MDVLTTIDKRHTAQTDQADTRQIKNSAGGYTFAVDDWARVHRFLTLGTDGGTYYTSAKDLTTDNAAVIFRAAASDPIELVRRIVDISVAGRAPKQNPALFALAIAAAADDVEGRRAALAALPQVARTASALFTFAKYVEQFRGWGPALKRAVATWYTGKPIDQLAYQVVKYRQRDGWTHRDLLRLSHPVTRDEERRKLFDYITRGVVGRDPDSLADGEHMPPRLSAIIEDYVHAQNTTFVGDWVEIVNRGHGLSWEMLPDAALGHVEVWEALLERGIPQTALMRQLPRLTKLGLAVGATGRAIAEQLQDGGRLKSARVHPINVLVALRTYTSGRSARGDSTWAPSPLISDALDAAFYNAFGAVEPTGKRTLLALDVSASMTSAVSGLPLSCREASAALAMVTAATEQDYGIIGFSGGLRPLDISPRRRLDDNIGAISRLPFDRTDCALPIVGALRNGAVVDTFIIYTDNETWYGPVHPHQALREYRNKVNPDARLAVVAMTASRNTIADPADPGQIDVSGFDGSVPQLLSDFSRGTI